MNPRASASFCHCPKLSSDAAGPGGAELRLQPRDELLDDVAGARTIDRGRTAGMSSSRGKSPSPTVCGRLEFEPKEILKRPGNARPPRFRRHPRQLRAIDEYSTPGRLIHPAQQLHERRSCRRRSRPRSRPRCQASNADRL